MPCKSVQRFQAFCGVTGITLSSSKRYHYFLFVCLFLETMIPRENACLLPIYAGTVLLVP
ncbi:hypothetical protein B0F90DRAFT_1720215 [Multifurca ochricompacta]|uniref:Uncharacterized protein n=1 Tax=Multifurca ochricompacta TaxID=376703 RepID=A0AAD4M6C6_9AGAM|nr:hypothetical protein B0F90DRAFT_1720215 [Multifurca ochricompacta]